jgi:hypothetical protein
MSTKKHIYVFWSEKRILSAKSNRFPNKLIDTLRKKQSE